MFDEAACSDIAISQKKYYDYTRICLKMFPKNSVRDYIKKYTYNILFVAFFEIMQNINYTAKNTFFKIKLKLYSHDTLI